MSNNRDKLSASPKQLSASVVKSAVENLYGLILFEPPIQMRGGVENVAWLLKTNQGKFVVKIFNPREGLLSKIKQEVKLCRHLNKHNICAPYILKSIKGQDVEELKTDGNLFPIILIKYEKLRRLKPSSIGKSNLTKIAKTIARMHQILRECPQQEKIKKLSHFASHTTVFSSFEIFSKSPNASVYTHTELAEIKKIDDKMVYFLSKHLSKANLTESILHGDTALEHAQILPSGEVYLFDFSDFMWGPVAHELAVFLVHLFREEDISFTRWEKLKEWLLAGYTAVSKLNAADFSAIRPFMIRRILGEIVYLSDIAIKSGIKVEVFGNKRRFKLAQYLLKT